MLLLSAVLKHHTRAQDQCTCEDLKAEVDQITTSHNVLVRQNMLQYLYMNERIRSEGDSGIKQVSCAVGLVQQCSQTYELNQE